MSNRQVLVCFVILFVADLYGMIEYDPYGSKYNNPEVANTPDLFRSIEDRITFDRHVRLWSSNDSNPDARIPEEYYAEKFPVAGLVEILGGPGRVVAGAHRESSTSMSTWS